MKKLENAEQNLRLSTSARARIDAALEAESTEIKQDKPPMRWAVAAAAVVLTVALLSVGGLQRPSAQRATGKTQREVRTAMGGESLRLCIRRMQ